MNIDLSQYNQTEDRSTESSSIMDLLNKDIQLFGNGLNMKKKEEFYTEMEILLRSGLDLDTALSMMQESFNKEKDKNLFAAIHANVREGDSFSEAIAKSGKFSEYEVSSLKIAEQAGKLAPILGELAQYFAKNLQYQRLLIGALSYPILVITVAVFALLFLLNFLVPLFGEIYGRLNQDLPGITQFIVSLSAVINQYLPYVSVGFLVLISISFWQRKKMWFRKYSSWLLLRMPIFGKLVHQIYLSRFCQAMAFLLDAKVPLLQAIELCKRMIQFYPLEMSLEQTEAGIFKGISLHECLTQSSIYPRRMLALIKVGEETNQLDNIFLKMANQYSEEVEQQTKLLGSLIEPVLIVFLALIVGVVLVSMYLPIFKLVTNFGM
jgi:type IV pilus assembly protein PilC